MIKKEPLLKIQDLSHKFSNGTVAVDSVDLEIYRSEFLIISGPNGSGKSVLMKHLNGLLTPSSGQIFLEDNDLFQDIGNSRQQIGLVFQDADSQIIGQTVEKDTAFGPENLRLKREEINRRVEKALKDVELLEKRKHRPHLLSGGEKRRLAIAGILAMDSKILIFDEPFSNLDYQGVKNVLSQIVELHRIGHTIIVITHDLGKVLAHGERLVIMNNGRIIHRGKPEDLLCQLENCGIRRPEGDCVESMTWLK